MCCRLVLQLLLLLLLVLLLLLHVLTALPLAAGMQRLLAWHVSSR